MLWALILGFGLSGVIMTFVSKDKMVNALGKTGPKQIATATFLGALSSSCSYAAAAMARTLFQKGAHIIPSLAFMLASTNLVIELSAVLWVMMGWQFVVAEFFGGLILVTIMSILMYYFSPLKDFDKIRENLNKLHSSQDDHHHGDSQESPANPKTFEGWSLVGQSFVSEWKMIGKDILVGVVISGFLMALVPDTFWQTLFLQNGGVDTFSFWRALENALVGPLVSVFSFVCSVGNIPLANVLYHGGISFGGALSFIYADLIIIPMILIYKKNYGIRGAIWITGIFYTSMVATGMIVDLCFHFLGLIPRHHEMPEMPGMPEMNNMKFFNWNYTTWLNIFFLIAAGILIWLSKRKDAPSESAGCCH